MPKWQNKDRGWGTPKGKGKSNQSWGSPDSKGKGKGAWPSQKGSWNPGKGSWGKGGKGAYGLEDDWSGQGYRQHGQEDTFIFWMGEEANPWTTPKGRKTCTEKPVKKGSDQIKVTGGRYAALGKIVEEDDLDIPIPLMMVEESGDVPETQVTKEKVVVPVPVYSVDTYSTIFRPGVSFSRASISSAEKLKRFRVGEMIKGDSQEHDDLDYRSPSSVDHVMDDLSQEAMDREEKPIYPLTSEEGEDHPEIPTLQSVPWRDESNPNWVKIRTVMDSGAAVSVAPSSMAPGVTIEESPGSPRGQHILSASKDRVPNMGQQRMPIVTNEGMESKVLYQVAEASRPLHISKCHLRPRQRDCLQLVRRFHPYSQHRRSKPLRPEGWALRA